MATLFVTTAADSGTGSLRTAIKTAKSGDTIRFSSNLANQTIRLTSGQIVLDKNLTIDGSGVTNLAISGNKSSRIFYIPSITNTSQSGIKFNLKNITMRDSYMPTELGGAIDAGARSNVRIENANFYNNLGKAGAVASRTGSNLVVVNSKFVGNVAAATKGMFASAGGVSALAENGRLVIQGSEFRDNKGFYGGGVASLLTETIVENSKFLNNSSRGYGGGLYVDGASRPTDAKYLPAGEPVGTGPGRNVIVRNSLFDGNKGTGRGGGVAIWGYDQDTVLIESSVVKNNSLVKDAQGDARGGGIRLSGIATIKNTQILNNTSAVKGGGVFFSGGTPVTISDSVVSGNRAIDLASGQGGGFFNEQWGSKTNISNTRFERNYAGRDAGAIYGLNPNVPWAIRTSSFSENKVGSSGQIQNSNLGHLGGSYVTFMRDTTVVGTDFNDSIVGYNKTNTLDGRGGNDVIDGLNGDDKIFGGNGNDILKGGYAHDVLDGQAGNDVLWGSDLGTTGHDTAYGGTGDDTFIGDVGYDSFTGGAGKDRIILGDVTGAFYKTGRLNIMDFNRVEDKIQLAGKASDYRIGATNSTRRDTALYYKDDLVAQIMGVSPDVFSLGAGYVSFNNTTNAASLAKPV